MDKKYISQVKVDDTIYNIKDNEAARIISPEFEGIPKAPTPLNNSVTTQIATIGYVNDAFKANDAMIFKGTIGPSGATVTTLPAKHEQGWTYKVNKEGTYIGQNCEPGDMIICITDGNSANDNHWTIVQNNMTYGGLPSNLDLSASTGVSAMVARADHVHKKPDLGNITYKGEISVTTEIANGDKILISDSSDNNIIKNSSINFDGSSEDKALTPKGTWGDFYTESEIDEKLDEKENIIIKNTSGSIAHFEDAAEGNAINVKIDFEPKQDLHGYDHPWPAGSGKNLLTFTPKTGTTNGVTFTWKEDGTVTATGTVTSGQSNAQQNVPINLPSGNYYFNGGYNSSNTCYVWCTTTNSRARKWNDSTASDSSANENLKEIKIEEGNNYVFVCYVNANSSLNTCTFKPMICASTETDTSFAPYSNICPITGYTEAKITRTGKNLLKNNSGVGTTVNGITWVKNSDGSINLSGTATATTDITINSNSAKQIIASGNVNIVCSANATYNPNIEGINFQSDIYVDGIYSKSIQKSSPTNSFSGNNISVGTSRIRIASGTIIPSGTVFYPAIEIGTIISGTWEPYKDTIYTISFDSAGTVYGGSLDVTTGVLTVDRTNVKLLSSWPWAKSSGIGDFYLSSTVVTNILQGKAEINSRILCSHAKFVTSSATKNIGDCWNNNNYHFYIISNDNSLADWKDYLDENDVYICYYLATPQTYQLTPTEIMTLLKINNIWCDIGNISIDYLVESSDKLAKYLSNKLSFDNIPTNNSYNPVYSNGIKTALDNKADNIIKNISNNPVIITDGSPTPVVDLTVKIEPIQSGNGEPSPTNIRSIFGRTKCNIIKTNKNLFPNRSYPISSNGITVNKNTDGSLKITGTATKNTYIYITNYSSSYNTGLVLPPGKYNFISGCETVDNNFRLQYSIYNNGNIVASAKPSGYNIVQQSINEGDMIDIYIYIPENRICNDILYPVISSNDCSIISVPWHTKAGTVYGGSLDVTTGVLTVNRVLTTITSVADNPTASYAVKIILPNAYPALTNNVPAPNLMASYLKTVSNNILATTNGNLICTTQSGNNSYIKIIGLTTRQEYDDYLSNNPLQVVYQLRDSAVIQYQLTPTEVITLLGENTILADTGIIDITYRADTKTYIDNIKSSAENSENAIQSMITQSFENDIATKNYNIGDLLIVNNQLLRVTTPINTGASISGKTSVVDLETIIGEKLDLHGTADNAIGLTPILLEPNTNLNDLLPEDVTWYRAGSGTTASSIESKPYTTSEQFTIGVYRTGNGTRVQILIRIDGIFYSRYYRNEVWSEWTEWNKIPIASNDTLGGIKVGQNLTIDDTGKLSNYITKTLSGNPIHFSDGIYSPTIDLNINIEPKQNLHSYDHPWLAGGGNNLMPSIMAGTYTSDGITVVVDNNNLITVSGTKNTDSAVKIELPYMISGISYPENCWMHLRNSIADNNIRFYFKTITNGFVTLSPVNRIFQFTAEEERTMQTAALSFLANIPSGTKLNFTLQPSIEQNDANTNYEPYENICPITGWTNCSITKGGKNYLETIPRIKKTSTYEIIVNDNGSLTFNGKSPSDSTIPIYNFADASANNNRQSDNKKHLSNGTYKKMPGDSDKGWYIQVYGSNIENAGSGNVTAIGGNTFTVNDTYKYNHCRLYLYDNKSFDNETFYPWIYKSDEVVEHTFTFPTEEGIIYGGSLDVMTGVLTVTHGLWTFDGSDDEGWTFAQLPSGIYRGISDVNNGMNNITDTDRNECLSNMGYFKPSGDAISVCFIGKTTKVYYYPPSNITTLEDYKAFLANNPLQIVYKLAEPRTYQLEPIEITTLFGENTISADGGIINITYKSDIKNYIDERLNEKLSLTGGTLTGDLTIYQESDILTNTPARIIFKPKDTTINQVYNNAYIAVYNDHYPTAANGTNMVLHSGGNLYIGSGESPRNLYSLKTTQSGESLYITSDNIVHIQSGANTIANRVGMQISTIGSLLPEKADTLVDNSGNIGGVNNRWANLYVTNINSTTLNVTDINSNNLEAININSTTLNVTDINNTNLEAININSNIYKINNQATIQWNESDESLDFIFT